MKIAIHFVATACLLAGLAAPMATALAQTAPSATAPSATASGATASGATASGATAQTQKLAPPANQAFVLFEFDIKDPAGFKNLSSEVRDSLTSYKGDFVMRGKVDSLFGGKPSNLSVISFPTVADARAWLASPKLAHMKAERDRVASVRTYLVEKLE